jgi:tellurite methyltransferase
VVDLSDAAALDAHLQDQARASAGSEVVVYCRFFLHAIPAALETRLIDALCRHLRAGFVFAAEFRTNHDEKLKKSFGTTHYRRFIDPEQLITRLEREHGATQEHVQIGFGLSVYAGEDPHLCRMVLRLPRKTT